jgi:phosphonate transport system ATP-binding protein
MVLAGQTENKYSASVPRYNPRVDTPAPLLLRATGLALTYPGGTRALAGVDFTLREGEAVAVIGKSGAGKSTLLRCLNGLLRPTAGRVEYRGGDIFASQPNLLRARREMGMVFQHFGLIPRLSILTNVAAGRLGSIPAWRGAAFAFSRAEREAARTALSRTGILDQERKRPAQLSGGQQQRVAIARALCQGARLLLADEPVSSLDPATARLVLDHMARICREDGIALVLNLHTVRLAKAYASRIVALRDGRVVYDGPSGGVDERVLEQVYGEYYADF